MRVLHVAEPTEGGVARCVTLDVAHQVGLGWDVAVARPRRPGSTPLPDGARSICWDAVPAPGPRTPAELLSLRRVLDDVRPDVVHLHSSKAGLVGRLLLRGRVPTIFQPHAWSFLAVEGVVARATAAWERKAATWAHRIVCVSEGEREVGKAHGVRGRWAVVPNGVDLDHFTPGTAADRAAAREHLALGAGPLVVCVGRLHRQKGQHVLLDAWPVVQRSLPDARLALVGDGPDADRLQERGAWLPGPTSDVRAWLHAADVVAMPSRWEGLSLALLEALACARSVVASDVPGMREVVRDDAGALVPYGAADALATAILARLHDPDLAAREGAAGRARVESEHDQRRSLDLLTDVTRQVAGG